MKTKAVYHRVRKHKPSKSLNMTETGSNQASISARKERNEPVEAATVLDPEVHRQQKIAEALKERERINRLNRENDARILEERKAARKLSVN